MSNFRSSEPTRWIRLALIMLYAMSGFANFGTLGIMIGGLARWHRNGATRSMRLGIEVDRIGHTGDLHIGAIVGVLTYVIVIPGRRVSAEPGIH